MSDYAIVGRKGTGKSLTAIGIIRDALIKNKRVATNLNVHLDKLMHHSSKKIVTRIPDHPSLSDFEAIGRGQEGVVEDYNGIIILDEVSHFMNSRQWGDKERLKLLEWLTQSRKMGWDVYYLTQGLRQLDVQVRETQLEYVVYVKRTDKWPIPFITPITRMLFGDDHAIRFPKMRLATTKHGIERDALVVSHKLYKAADLFPAYDTQQLFLDRDHPQSCGVHTQLSAWHLKGRYLQRKTYPLSFWLTLPLRMLIFYSIKALEWGGADEVRSPLQRLIAPGLHSFPCFHITP